MCVLVYVHAFMCVLSVYPFVCVVCVTSSLCVCVLSCNLTERKKEGRGELREMRGGDKGMHVCMSAMSVDVVLPLSSSLQYSFCQWR